MRAGSGHSEKALGVEAVQAALSEALAHLPADAVDLVFLFATYHHLDDIPAVLDAAIARAGTDAVVGCTGMGVISGQEEIERGPGMAVLALSGEDLTAVPFLARGENAAAEIGETVRPYVRDGAVLVLLPDVFHYHPTQLIEDLRESVGDLPIVGGAASGNPGEQRTLQWLGREVCEDGVAGVLLSGDFQVATGVAQGCQPFGQAYTVTKAEGNVIHEIAFGPAVDALKEALDTLTPEEKENVGRSIFIGLAMDEYTLRRGRGDYLIRNLMAMDPRTGALAVGERVEVGQTVQFNLRTAGAAHEDILEVLGRLVLEEGGGPPGFGLYFNCMGRGFGLYGQPDHDVSAIRSCLGGFPLAGFFGNAEFAPVGGRNFVHNYTGALVLFSQTG